MTPKRNGGQAFPRDYKWGGDGSVIQDGFSGMTLRDYFAGRVVLSFMLPLYPEDRDLAPWAALAYRMADAMLAERSKS